MRVVSVTGISGGIGTTTVVAQLASTLAALGRRVIAFDFSPQNALRLHFGMRLEEGNGLVPQLSSGSPWNEAAYRCENGVDFLPFGKSGEEDIARFHSLLQQDATWLSSRLGELAIDDDTWVLIDCPCTGHALRSQVQAVSDVMLVTLRADAMCYAALAGSAISQAPSDEKDILYLINAFDPTLALDRDIAKLIRAEQGSRLCPVAIHRDEAVREALASKLSVDTYAPYSQAAGDFADLATWLTARLARQGTAP